MRILIFFFLLVFSVGSHAQSLNGTVTNENKSAVAGASVYVLNTNRGVATDTNGKFNITDLSAGAYTVQVSAIGYATLEKVINLSKENSGAITFTLVTDTRHLDAVVVTAEKREEILQRVPLSITALSARQVQQYRLWNTKDLTAIVPNLNSANSGDERNVTSIRGIATTSYDPAVATYVDGVNQFSLDTYIPQLLEVDRIEVLRGPQGTLYGRNAMGGVINIITKQPTNNYNGFAEVTMGNKHLQRYSAGFTAPLIQNKLFLGGTALYEKRNGYYRNEFYNNSFDKQHKLAGNYFLKFVADAHWTATLNVKHQDVSNNGAFPMVNGVADAFANPFVLSQDATAKMIDNTINGSLVISYAGSGFNFTSQTAYQSNHRYYNKPLDGDFSPIDGVSIINDYGDGWNKVRAWTQEFKFTSPANSGKWKWTAGTYLFHQDNPTKQGVHFGNDALLVGAPDVNFTLLSSTKGKTSGLAFYGQTSYSINSKLSLIAGLRYDAERKKYNVLGEYLVDPDPTPIFETVPDTSASANFHAFSPKLGLDYAISSEHNLFVSYSRGYRTGGLTQLSSDPQSQPPLFPYKPEYSNNIEAGIKNNFLGNRLRLNITLFYTTVTDAQVPTLVLPDAVTVTRNAGKLESKGAEIELSATPAKGLQIDYNFGYTDAEYKSLDLSQNGSSVDLKGKKQIFTPKFTSFLAAQYTYVLKGKSGIRLFARGEVATLGKQYFDLGNTISQRSYSLVNVRAGAGLHSSELTFWARNIGSYKYISYAYDFGAVHLGDPGTFGVTLLTRFGKR